MVDVIGFDVPIALPSVNISGFLSSTWFYVVIIAMIGFLLIVATFVILFLVTYNKKIVFFENIAGRGFQPTAKRRARIVKLGVGGTELLRVIGGDYITAYGRKMGKNAFWFAKGEDGYWYNFIMADLDAKRATLDINPIEKDVRMFHAARDKMIREAYQKQNWMMKYGLPIMFIIALAVFLIGTYINLGVVKDAAEVNIEASKIQERLADKLGGILAEAERVTGGTQTGIIPAGGS